MDFLNLSQGSSAILALIVVIVMLVLFVRETLPTEVVALAGTAVMLALGILPYDDAQAVLQNSAPWTIAAMFLVMGALLIRNADHKISTDSRLTRPGMWPGFIAGVIAILGNPKAVLFYVGVLPGFFDLRAITWVDVLAIVACSVSIPLIGNIFLAAGVGHIRGFVTSKSNLKRINITSGLLMICVGVLIPLF